MDLYSRTSYQLSEILTKKYSTSFSSSSQLFSKEIRPDIFAIYGMVRLADEIVDTYKGKDAELILNDFEKDVYSSIESQYSTNPILQSFALTAKKYEIDKGLIKPFFDSMRFDLKPQKMNSKNYQTYIYGSAEVVGLMCLKVFISNDTQKYQQLEAGARALGSAYQKVNFLRDMKTDYEDLGRVYFPGINFKNFNDDQKEQIINDIENDFKVAKEAVVKLPSNSKKAVATSFYYYSELLDKLKKTSAQDIKSRRVRVSNFKKSLIFIKSVVNNV